MKLLPKSEIAQRKADAQKQTIDEGQRLAKRIDSLRDTLLEEEKSLEKFRRETVAQIHAQILDEKSILESLKEEVSTLTEERERLLVPLDEKWEEVNQESTRLEELTAQVIVREQEAEKRKVKYDLLVEEASDSLKNTLVMEENARLQLREASERNIVARREEEESTEQRKRTEELHQNMIHELKQRDEHLASRERDCTIKESKLLERESALESGWKLLEDRKAKLERTIKRLKQ